MMSLFLRGSDLIIGFARLVVKAKNATRSEIP
jgi:hypothetical protein